MERLIKIGDIKAKHSKNVSFSKLGIGFEKLDRDAFDPTRCYDRVAELGVKWVRIQSGWAKTEKEKGIYDFAWLDTIVENLLSRGLVPWICLCYGNGLYSELAAQTYGGAGVPPIGDPEMEEAWDNYVRAIVKHFAGRVDTFEIWNEPDGLWCWKTGVNGTELGAFTNRTGRCIKEANQNAYVIGGAFYRRNMSYFNEAMAAGFGEYLDGITYHEYTHDETSVRQTVSSYRALCKYHGKDLEIIQGESGSQSRSDGRGAVKRGAWTQQKQTKQLLRHTVADLMTKVKFTSYFSCIDMKEALQGTVDDPDSYKDYGYFGVLGAQFDENGFATGDYAPKLSYRALQVLASIFAEQVDVDDVPVILERKESTRIFDMDERLKDVVYQGFTKPNGSYAYAYWKPTNIMTTDYEGTVSLKLTSKDAAPKLVDLMDGSVYEIPESMYEKDDFGTYEITNLPIKDYPMLIVCGDFLN